jgi:hypothetical protein
VSPILGRGLGFAVLLCAAEIRADPTPVGAPSPSPPHSARLTYERGRGADHCPDEQALRSAVSTRLGYDPFRPDAQQTVSVVIRRSDQALRGDLALRDAAETITGTRQLSSVQNDCPELVAAMALAISIAIDPQSQLRPLPSPSPSPALAPASPADASAPDPGSAPPPSPLSPAAEPPSKAPPTASPRPIHSSAPFQHPAPLRRPLEPGARPPAPAAAPVRLRVSAGTLIEAGAAPGISVGFAAQLGIRWPAFSVSLEGRANLPASKRVEPVGVVSLSRLMTTLTPCLHWELLLVCGVGSIGALSGSGAGVAHPKDDVTPFAAVGLRGGVEIPIAGALSATMYGDYTAILLRTTLRLAGRDVWTAPPVSAALGAGLVGSFP